MGNGEAAVVEETAPVAVVQLNADLAEVKQMHANVALVETSPAQFPLTPPHPDPFRDGHFWFDIGKYSNEKHPGASKNGQR